MNNVSIYIQIAITTLCTIAYIFTYRYQASKMKILEQTLNNLNNQVSSQSKIISDFEKYKSLFDIDDFEKRMKLKLENQKDELNIFHKTDIDKSIDEFSKITMNTYKNEHGKILNGYEELATIALNIIIKQFPTIYDKPQRDIYINTHYPHNKGYFIEVIDFQFRQQQIHPNAQT